MLPLPPSNTGFMPRFSSFAFSSSRSPTLKPIARSPSTGSSSWAMPRPMLLNASCALRPAMFSSTGSANLAPSSSEKSATPSLRSLTCNVIWSICSPSNATSRWETWIAYALVRRAAATVKRVSEWEIISLPEGLKRCRIDYYGAMNARTLFILVLVGILWGASYVFTKVAIAETSVLTLVTIQTFISGVAIFAYMRARQVPFIATSGLWPKAAGMALLNTIIPLLLVAWAVIRIDAGVAAVLNATMPLFAALFSALLLADERLNLSRAGGLIVGFAGVIVFTNGDIFNLNDSNVVAELAVIAAAASWGLNAVYARVVIRTEDPLTLTGTYFMMAVVILSAILLIFDWPPDARMSAKAWACIASAGALSGAL